MNIRLLAHTPNAVLPAEVHEIWWGQIAGRPLAAFGAHQDVRRTVFDWLKELPSIGTDAPNAV